MTSPRASGLLLHPTSLPGPHGMGSFGEAARQFVDLLAETGHRYWQVLPLGPTGYGNSPYQAFSAFAGNPLLVDLQDLVAEGLLEADQLADAPDFPGDRVDFGAAIPWRMAKLRLAFERFERLADAAVRARLEAFVREQAGWLDDYALFMALKDQLGGSWSDWEAPLRGRDPAALERARHELADRVRFHAFAQYAFFTQYAEFKRYANAQRVEIIGDLPIFVAYDSADAWSHPELFHFDPQGHPTVVAGVPPDYFSKTGQLWGNPLYRWEALAQTGYHWWIARMKQALTMYDVVRLDHFRGFEAYWEVQAGEPTAEHGRWVKGPDRALFDAMEQALGRLPIIAEDLGLITPEVEALRDGLGLPGMKILQFAWGSGPDASYLPHNYSPNCVVYTGTHDNDTTVGWFETAPTAARDHARRYMACNEGEVPRQLIRLALGSVARLAVIPMQDWLELDSQARMNTPGESKRNWEWRMDQSIAAPLRARMKVWNDLYGRTPVVKKAPAAAV